MPFEAGLFAYAGLAGMAAAMSRHRPRPGRMPLPHPRLARAIGATLLVFSMLAAMRRFGPSQGIIVGVAQICLAAGLLVLVMSWRQKVAFALALPSAAAAALTAASM